MTVPVMTQDSEAAAQADVAAASGRPDLRSLAFLAVIAIAMTAWIGGLVWAAIAFLTWLVS